MKYSAKCDKAMNRRISDGYSVKIGLRLSRLIGSFAGDIIIINDRPAERENLIRAKAQNDLAAIRSFLPFFFSYLSRSLFNLPVTSEKLKLRPSGSGSIGNARWKRASTRQSRIVPPRAEEEAERDPRVSCKRKPTTASSFFSFSTSSCCLHRDVRSESSLYLSREIYTRVRAS